MLDRAQEIPMNTSHAWLEAPVRLLMALLFLVSATTKVVETAGIQAYMRAYSVPEVLIWPAAAWEYAAAALLALGLLIRPLSLLLAAWCVLTALIFHTKFSDLSQLMNFFKNMSIAGGFLMVVGTGSRGGSLDCLLASRRRAADQGRGAKAVK
jgi:putative oxidoreductase